MKTKPSIWETHAAAREIALRMSEEGATYPAIRQAINEACGADANPTNSQIYRLRRDSGQVEKDRDRPVRNGAVSVWDVMPYALKIATDLIQKGRPAKEICGQIAEEMGDTVTPNQIYKLKSAFKRQKATADDADCADESGQEPAITGNNEQQSAIAGTERPETAQDQQNPPVSPFIKGGKTPEPAVDDNNRSLLEGGVGGPFSSEKEPTTVSSPSSGPLYTRPCTTPLAARPTPRGFPSTHRDKFAADLVEIPELSAQVRDMLSHNQAEGCKLPGVIRQSLISCLKRQVTAGHPRYIKPLGGGGLALNLFYLRCSLCPNFLSDHDCDAVIEGLREIWRKRASERNRRVA